MDRPLVVLGATGSIGSQTLEVAHRSGMAVAAVAAGSGSEPLFQIGTRWPDSLIGVATPTEAERDRFSSTFGRRVTFGAEAIEELARIPNSLVMNGIVGSAGLAASVAAVESGNRLGLANKESLVAGGSVLLAAQTVSGAQIVPVDSEHSAIFQCLHGERRADVARIILTASGGPFRGRTRDELEHVTPADALAHPTWEMGRRISVDSATLVNKGLEVIEAHYLFDISYDDIDVVVHPQSIVHSLVEYVDGSSKAHLGEPDMRVPIQYAITYPDRASGPLEPFRLAGHTLTFHEPDRIAFPALDLAYDVGRAGGSAPAVFNAADEVAVEAFLKGRLAFLQIVEIIERTLDEMESSTPNSVAEVLMVDAQARKVANRLVSEAC